MLRIIVVVVVATSPVLGESVSLQLDGRNAFRTDIVLNGRVSARAMIDTGASFVTLCQDIAYRLGLSLGPSIRMLGPLGAHESRRATIDSVRIGEIELYNIEAVVKPAGAPCDPVLVGMSVLRRLDFMMLQDDVLTLGMR